jgi:hypothetical protein
VHKSHQKIIIASIQEVARIVIKNRQRSVKRADTNQSRPTLGARTPSLTYTSHFASLSSRAIYSGPTVEVKAFTRVDQVGLRHGRRAGATGILMFRTASDTPGHDPNFLWVLA